nr:redoxin domain-containing protein [Pedobacter panaciterrae]
MKKSYFTYFIALFILCSATFSYGQVKTLSWKKIAGIQFVNTSAKKEEIKTTETTVFIMLSPECPLCRNYIQTVNALHKKYPEVQFYGIFPGKAYKPNEIATFQKEYKVDFKLLIDDQKLFTKYVKATTTPECILVNKMGIIAYRGLIDNWASSLGQQRKVITEHYLEAAIDDELNHRNISTKQTTPVGCLINDI